MRASEEDALCKLVPKDTQRYRANDGLQHLATVEERPVAPPGFFEPRRSSETLFRLGSSETAEVLRVARKKLVMDGWHPVRSTLFSAVWGQPVSVARIEARRLLERVGRCYLTEWDLEPLRRRGDAVRLIDSALRFLGVPRAHRGGWTVTGATR